MWARGEGENKGEYLIIQIERMSIINDRPREWVSLTKTFIHAKTLEHLDIICAYLYFNIQAFSEDKTQGNLKPVIIRATIN